MKTRVVLIVGVGILIGFLFPVQSHAAQAWCDTDWSNRKQITISNTNVDSDLTDFPLLISITDTDVSANANSDALDIFFTEETTCAKLKWEKESYTSGTGVLVAWVKVPTVDADANTTLYMYYGNSGASDQTDAANTWNSNYKGVWHLSETPDTDSGTDEILDSTSNNNDGDTTDMTSGDQVAGQIDGSLDFDGSDYITGPTGSSLNLLNGFTATVWFKTNTNGVRRIFDKGGYTFGQSTAKLVFTSRNVKDYFTVSNYLTEGEWVHIAYVFDSSNDVDFYVDGVFKETVTHTSPANSDTTAYIIGSSDGTGQFWFGLIDELRITSTELSAAWIKFSYHSQKVTAGTLTFAAQESPSSGGRRPTPFRFTSREVTNISSNSALVTWATTIPTYTELNWSTSPSQVLDQSSFQSYELTTFHSVSLDNLSSNTTYYYVINAPAPGKGNIATGPWSFFTLPEDTQGNETTEDTQTSEESSQDQDLLLEQLKQRVRELQLQLLQLMVQLVSILKGGL